MKKIFNINVFADLGLLAFEALWMYKAIDLSVNGWADPYCWGDMGTIPKFMTGVMIVLTLVDLVRNIIKNAKSEPVEKSPEEKKGAWLAVAEIATIGVYAFTMEYVGYIITTIILLAATMLYSGNRNWKLIAAISVGVTVGLYALFRYGLHIYLPTLFL